MVTVMISKARKKHYQNLIRDLRYEEKFVKRVEKCKTEEECRQILEFARISSINRELKYPILKTVFQ